MKSNRNITADLLKGIAVIAMVLVHIVELFATNDIFVSSIGRAALFIGGPPAAPVFMIVMGFFIAKNNQTGYQSVIRGLKLILTGFALNLGLNFHLLLLIKNGTIDTSPWAYIFGVDIFFLAGLSIILLSFLNGLRVNKLFSSLFAIVVVFGFQFLFPVNSNHDFLKYLTAYFYSDVWWSYFPVIPWIAYPLAGYAFYHITRMDFYTRLKALEKPILLLSIVILILTISYGINIASNLQLYYHHDYLYYLFTINFVIILSLVTNQLSVYNKNITATFIQWLGKNVTVFYIIQWLLIGNIATYLFKTQTIWQTLIWFVLILVISSLLTFVWINRYKIPHYFGKVKNS